jgi:hypothetical protein
MRAAPLLVLVAGCRQLFDLEPPQLSRDATAVVDAGDQEDAHASRSCSAQWIVGPQLGPIAALTGVNTSGAERNPFVTADGTTLYFVRDADVYVAQRSYTGFMTPVIDPALSSASNDGKVSVSPDRLHAFFSSNRFGGRGGRDIWRGYRASTEDDWAVDQMYLDEINDASQQYDPHVSTDLLRLYYAPKLSGQRIVVASRASETTPFDSATPVDNLAASFGSSDDYDPTLSGDELVIVFGSTRSGSKDLWYATRTSASAQFGPPIALGALDTGGAEENPHLSSDGCTLYFSSDRGASADLYATSVID